MRLLRRIGITILGGGLTALGIALLVLPGPGLLVVAAGLLVLGLEYEWARVKAMVVRDKAWAAARQASSSKWSTTTAVLGALAIIGAGFAVGIVEELPAHSWWTGGSLIFGGLICLATVIAGSVVVARERQGE